MNFENSVMTHRKSKSLTTNGYHSDSGSKASTHLSPLAATAITAPPVYMKARLMPHFLTQRLAGVSPRWQNWIVRFIFCSLMNLCVFGFTYFGIWGLSFMIFLIEWKIWREMLSMDPAVRIEGKGVDNFGVMATIFSLAVNYYCFGESLCEFFRIQMSQNIVLDFLIQYHLVISLSFYLAAFLYFIFKLDENHYRKQFSQLGWIHCWFFYLAIPINYQVNLTMQGIIWTFLPVMQVVTNDIFAYLCGFFLGRTALTSLSPNKTWEGFLGAILPTFLLSSVLSQVLLRWDHFVCPLDPNGGWVWPQGCTRNPILEPTIVDLREYEWLPLDYVTVYTAFLPHCFILALFASIGSPVLGGFFASGMKRAFRMKDFDNLIPGHGGVLDRVDCQIVMTVFTWVYFRAIVHIPTTNQLVQHLHSFPIEQRKELLFILNKEFVGH